MKPNRKEKLNRIKLNQRNLFWVKQNGSIVIPALIIMATIASLATFLPTLRTYTEKTIRYERARAELSVIQSRIQALSLLPHFYNCNNSTCTLKSADILAQIPSGKVTGSQFQVARVNNQWEFSGVLSYYDPQSKIRLKDAKILSIVPDEIMMSNLVDCAATPATPIFKGFSSSGAVICAALPKPKCSGSRDYVKAVGSSDMSVDCEPIASASIGCKSSSTKMDSFKWDGGANFSGISCGSRLDPFQLYQYDPNQHWITKGSTCLPTPPSCNGTDLVYKDSCGKTISMAKNDPSCASCQVKNPTYTCEAPNNTDLVQKDSCGKIVDRKPASTLPAKCQGMDLVTENECGLVTATTKNDPSCVNITPITLTMGCGASNNNDNTCSQDVASLMAQNNIRPFHLSISNVQVSNWGRNGCDTCYGPTIFLSGTVVNMRLNSISATVVVTLTDSEVPVETQQTTLDWGKGNIYCYGEVGSGPLGAVATKNITCSDGSAGKNYYKCDWWGTHSMWQYSSNDCPIPAETYQGSAPAD